MQGDDWNSHFDHCGGEFFHSAACASETISAIDAAAVRMPEQIAVTFEIVGAVLEFDHTIVPLATPLCIERHFTLTRGVHHAAGHYKFSVSTLLADENLIRSEDHLFKAFDRIDSMKLASILLQNTTESFPLLTRFHPVDCGFSRHIRIFLIDDIEIIRRTEKNLKHTIDGSWTNRIEARKPRCDMGPPLPIFCETKKKKR